MPFSATTPLRVSPQNPRYLEVHGKPTALVTSGEHYGAVLNADFDVRRYLDTLVADHLNLTRVFSGAYRETWGTGWNTLNPAAGRFLAPWARSNVPGYKLGGNRFDLTRWDEAYWTRLKTYVAEAGKRHIVVEYVLFCVWYDEGQWQVSPLNTESNVNGVGTGAGKEFFAETQPSLMAAQAAFVRKAASELSRFDNVYFELCNEPYFEGPSLESAWNKRIAGEIRAVHPKAVIALNVANGSQRVATRPEGVDVLNFHYAAPPTAIEENAALHCPVAFDESGFRGIEDTPYRTEAWEFLLAGGALYNGLDWSFSVGKEDGTERGADPKIGPRSPSLRKSLGVLARFMNELDLGHLQPRPDLVSTVPAGVTARVLAEPGHQYAAYCYSSGDTKSGEIRLKVEPGKYRLKGIDPATGAELQKGEIKHSGGDFTLRVPDLKTGMAVSLR